MSRDRNEALIRRFYDAFTVHDAAGMNACYTPGIRFRDPVFGPLEGDRARGMWTMLNQRSADLELTYQVGEVDDSTGNATWQARYDFSATHRRVDNHITSKFWFDDGLIARQEDTFSLWRWASMALGPKGQLLGWLPPVQGKIRKQATAGLNTYLNSSS